MHLLIAAKHQSMLMMQSSLLMFAHHLEQADADHYNGSSDFETDQMCCREYNSAL